MRAFLALTEDQLARLVSAGRLAERVEGYAATPDLRAALGLDDEELEYALSTAAGELAAANALEAGTARGRRSVAVVELPSAEIEILDATQGQVAVGLVTVARTEAILADPGPVDLAAPPGDLAWYATQELDS